MIDAMAGAGDYAGWLQPTIQPIHTQIAFLGYEFLPIKLHHSKLGVVRAKRPRRLECGWIRELGAGFRLTRPLCDVRSLFAIGLASGLMRSRADDHGYSSELLSPGTAAYLSIWSGITRRPLLRITASVLSKGSISQGSPAIQMCERLPGLRRQVRKTNTARLTRRGHAGAKVAQKNPKWWLTPRQLMRVR